MLLALWALILSPSFGSSGFKLLLGFPLAHCVFLLLRTFKIYLPVPLLCFSILLLVAGFWSLLSSYLHRVEYDFTIVQILFTYLFSIFFSATYLYLLRKTSGDTPQEFFERVLFVFCLMMGINSVVMVACFLSYDIRLLVEGVLHTHSSSGINYLTTERFRGFSSTGGTNLSLLCFLAMAAVYALSKVSPLNNATMGMWMMLLMTGAMLSGRSGILMCVIFLSLIILRMFMDGRFPNAFKLIAAFVFMAALVSLSPLFTHQYIMYNFSFLWNSLADQNNTLSKISNYYSLSAHDLSRIVWGYGSYTGNLTDQKHFVADSGYMRSLSSWGLIFSIAVYASLLVVISLSLFKKAIMQSFGGFVVVLIITAFVFEAKQTQLLSGYTSRLLILLMICGAMIDGSRRIDQTIFGKQI